MSTSLEEAIGLVPGERVLVYGIGNVGRQDDGIGVHLVERLEHHLGHVADDVSGAAGPAFESNYQLGIEDALLLSRFDVVLFLDASCDGVDAAPYTLRPVASANEIAFTTHAMGFSSVLSICEELYGCKPRAFLLAVRGYQWDIAEGLSPQGRINFDNAFESLAVMMQRHRRPEDARSRADG
jgi:hydrogenase maturation protease